MARSTNEDAAELPAGTPANVGAAARAGDLDETTQPEIAASTTLVAETPRMGVYAIRNTVNGAVYVGSARDIDVHWRQHRAALDRSSHANGQLQAAWTRHGAPAFQFIILERVESRDALAQAEQRWIDRYGAADLRHVYNSQTRVIRRLRKLLTLDEAAQRLGLRPAALRRRVEKGLVSCHHGVTDGSSRADREQIGFDPEEIGRAREQIREAKSHRVAEMVARLRVHQEWVRRWFRRRQ